MFNKRKLNIQKFCIRVFLEVIFCHRGLSWEWKKVILEDKCYLRKILLGSQVLLSNVIISLRAQKKKKKENS